MIHLPDSINSFLFLFLEVGIVVASLGVVTLRKIIYSALLLAIVLLCVALLYLLLNADFMAASQVLVYVGAINVLIVFAIMLVNKPEAINAPSWTLANGMIGLLSTAFFGLLLGMIIITPWQLKNSVPTWPPPLEKNIQVIGFHLLTDLLAPFELLSVLLLVTLIGAITIARRDISIKITEKTQSKKTDLQRP